MMAAFQLLQPGWELGSCRNLPQKDKATVLQRTRWKVCESKPKTGPGQEQCILHGFLLSPISSFLFPET